MPTGVVVESETLDFGHLSFIFGSDMSYFDDVITLISKYETNNYSS